ncbi:MAG: polysaccharide biosynthesis protein, partial [Acidobacteriota bacterium]
KAPFAAQRGLITLAGLVPDSDIQIEWTGLRPGEKLSEELLTSSEQVVRVVDEKIRVVEGPSPPDLDSTLESLRAAAAKEDVVAILNLLRVSVPEYRAALAGETPTLDFAATTSVM